MDEASRRKLETTFGHNPFTEAISQTLRAQFSFRVWLLALPGEIKATKVHVTCSQSGVEIEESFVFKKKYTTTPGDWKSFIFR